jgi:hypothetical protein
MDHFHQKARGWQSNPGQSQFYWRLSRAKDAQPFSEAGEILAQTLPFEQGITPIEIASVPQKPPQSLQCTHSLN